MYGSHTLMLLRSQYDFVSVQTADTIEILRSNGYDVTNQNVADILEGLRPDTVIAHNAMKILAETVKDVWLGGIIPSRRVALLHRILDVLTDERGVIPTVNGFVQYLNVEFRFLQPQLDEVVERLWVSQNEFSRLFILLDSVSPSRGSSHQIQTDWRR